MTRESDGEEREDRRPVSFETEVRDDRTIITVDGQRDVAVVVRDDTGERVYLPPEDSVGEDAQEYGHSPYSPAPSKEDDSTYQSGEGGSPYSRAGGGEDSFGRRSVPTGIRIVHPEPVDDVRFLK